MSDLIPRNARRAVPEMNPNFVAAIASKNVNLKNDATPRSIMFPSLNPEFKAIDVVSRSVTLRMTVQANRAITENSYAETRLGTLPVFR